jgi:hypothetical protein
MHEVISSFLTPSKGGVERHFGHPCRSGLKSMALLYLLELELGLGETFPIFLRGRENR